MSDVIAIVILTGFFLTFVNTVLFQGVWTLRCVSLLFVIYHKPASNQYQTGTSLENSRLIESESYMTKNIQLRSFMYLIISGKYANIFTNV